MRLKAPLLAELYDVFSVRQVTRDSSLDEAVAVDLVYVAPKKRSQRHRHNRSDTLLLILGGAGTVSVGNKSFTVKKGDRIHIPPGAMHGVSTGRQPLKFLSIQLPPILHKRTQRLDLEYD